MERTIRRRADKKLKKLYAKIPTFKCEQGCTACCGVVPWSLVEFEKVKIREEIARKMQAQPCTITPMRTPNCSDCPFYIENKGCSAYEERPLMCRLYGTTESLECPKGHRPSKMLSKEQANKIMIE